MASERAACYGKCYNIKGIFEKINEKCGMVWKGDFRGNTYRGTQENPIKSG